MCEERCGFQFLSVFEVMLCDGFEGAFYIGYCFQDGFAMFEKCLLCYFC